MSSKHLLIYLVRRHPGLIIFNILFGFSGALFNGISTALIIPVLLSFLGQPVATKGAPPILQSLLGPFQNIAGEYNLLLMTAAILLMIVLKNVAAYCNSLVSGMLKRVTANDLRDQGLKLLLEVDMDYYVKMGVGDIINRLNNEISRAASAISTVTRSVTVAITTLVFITLLLSMSWQLTIVSTVLLTLVALVNQQSIARSRSFGKELSDTSRNYSTKVLDLLSGMRLVRATANEQTEYEKIKAYIYNREQAEFRSQATAALIEPMSEVSGIVALLCIVLVGRTFLKEQVDAFSAILLTYLFVLFRTLPLIAQLNGTRSQLANVSPSLDIAQDFLRRDNKSFMPNGTIPFHTLKAGIHFQQLAFAYPGQKKQILKDVDLYVPRNTTLALVGASGAGKSTLADLLPRFYDPTAGCITIDGQDLRDFDFRTLRRAMGIVSQDTFLFNITVRENIAYGYPDATDDQIIAAAQQTSLCSCRKALKLKLATGA
jgi:ATP-binding cassette, subfamily B, bacterial MsbA